MFLKAKIIKRFGIEYYAVYNGDSLITTFMSEFKALQYIDTLLNRIHK